MGESGVCVKHPHSPEKSAKQAKVKTSVEVSRAFNN